jgi:hypothetical protein
MGVGGGGGLAMSAAMAGMPIAAANKAAVMAFFIIFLRRLHSQSSILLFLPTSKVAPEPHKRVTSLDG